MFFTFHLIFFKYGAFYPKICVLWHDESFSILDQTITHVNVIHSANSSKILPQSSHLILERYSVHCLVRFLYERYSCGTGNRINSAPDQIGPCRMDSTHTKSKSFFGLFDLSEGLFKTLPLINHFFKFNDISTKHFKCMANKIVQD